MTAREHILEALEHITRARQLSEPSAAFARGTINLAPLNALDTKATETYQRMWEGGPTDTMTTRFTR